MDFCTKMSGLLLFDQIDKDLNKNIVVSPLSFRAILNMITAGSSGPTLKQMLGCLDSESIDEINSRFSEFMAIAATNEDNSIGGGGGPVTCFVNGAWVTQRCPLKDSYQKLLKDVYNAEARNVDFAKVGKVVEEVNAWAKSATKGLITNILEPHHIRPDTKLILGNALYFKGSWKKPFDKSSTMDIDFHLLNGKKVKVPFMTDCPTYSYESFEDFKVLKIPYEARKDSKTKLSMCIFLPNERDGLQNLLKRMNSDPEFFTKHSKPRYQYIDILRVPKFKFTYCTEAAASNTMKKMGLILPFDEECEDLTEMVDGEPVFISTIIQKACVEIDEKGTEAAAVTRTLLLAGSAMRPKQIRPKIEFVADHPFLFMIKEENSGSVFFVGAVLNPFSPEMKAKNENDSLPLPSEKEGKNESDCPKKEAKNDRERKRRKINIV